MSELIRRFRIGRRACWERERAWAAVCMLMMDGGCAES